MSEEAPRTETWFQWKTHAPDHEDRYTKLCIPLDPRYDPESSFEERYYETYFASREVAIAQKEFDAPAEDWWLCEVTIRPVHHGAPVCDKED